MGELLFSLRQKGCFCSLVWSEIKTFQAISHCRFFVIDTLHLLMVWDHKYQLYVQAELKSQRSAAQKLRLFHKSVAGLSNTYTKIEYFAAISR